MLCRLRVVGDRAGVTGDEERVMSDRVRLKFELGRLSMRGQGRSNG